MSRWLGAALVLLLGCGPTQMVGSRFIDKATLGTQGGVLEVTADEDALLAGTRLEVPAGALQRETTLTIDRGLGDLVHGGTSLGAIAIFGPEGLVFSTPARLTLPIDGGAGLDLASVVLAVEESDGTTRELSAVSLQAGAATFSLDGFSRFQPKAKAACGVCPPNRICRAGRCAVVCGSDADCGMTEQCTNGACEPIDAIDAGPAPDAGGLDAGPLDAGTDGGPSIRQCMSDSDCTMFGGVCGQGVCIAAPADGGPRCRSDMECPINSACVMGSCLSRGPFDAGPFDAGSSGVDGGGMVSPNGDGGRPLDAGRGDGG